jgi:hypothetical protein
MTAATLHALVPQMTPEEVTEFIQYRDSEEQDNQFKSTDDFYKQLQTSVAAFKNNNNALEALKKNLSAFNLLTDETQFKITIEAHVNNATRRIEAWVTLGDTTGGGTSQNNVNPPSTGASPKPQTAVVDPNNPATNSVPPADSGLKITFMRMF